MSMGIRGFVVALALCMITSWSASASADEASKEACLESHSRGQDARDQGKLSLARKLFMSCAQPACPALAQNDCARFADDLERHQSWLSFVARDSAGNDLPDTTVYVDDVLLMTRLDDGKAHEVDPGRHIVRFAYNGRERVVTLVVGNGEKGRTVVGLFEGPGSGTREHPSTEEPTKKSHSVGSRAVLAAGSVLAVGGATLGFIGLSRVPASCSVSSHECADVPGSSSFAKASAAVSLSNLGWTVAGVGAVAVAAGLVWYFKSATSERATSLEPILTPTAAGLSLSGRL